MEGARFNRKGQVSQNFRAVAVAQAHIGKLDQKCRLPNRSDQLRESGINRTIAAHVPQWGAGPPWRHENGLNVVDFGRRKRGLRTINTLPLG
jgi:hypothetical protein